MAKRFIDCGASDFRNMNKYEILKSIAQSEGRVLACETIGAVQPMLGNLTNAELAAAMGADFLILNMFDVNDPFLWGMPP
ncbi:MAG: haloacid dehalogenase-like hydrolase, partial [Ruminococcaceae bacterium]|nr:haloacid dehalogenase-like hydrolase [Oscillospiraceae bacterium]